jgi:aromatic ring-opening dioxygenase catalytic subunit (LigB family)
MATTTRMPTAFIFHGGGPCFFMDWDPPDAWDELRVALEGIGPALGARPSAIAVVTAHWEAPVFSIESGAAPELIYDYGGFPPHTYQLTYRAPGAPDVARRAAALLEAAGIAHDITPNHGWDHGVFIPLKVMFPDEDVPVFAISVRRDFDARAHLELGAALAPLRDEGVFILGSGASFHHFGNFGREDYAVPFDDWLNDVVARPAVDRWEALANWEQAPHARDAHVREEHLLQLMVAVGAASDVPARSIFHGRVLDTTSSCWLFD